MRSHESGAVRYLDAHEYYIHYTDRTERVRRVPLAMPRLLLLVVVVQRDGSEFDNAEREWENECHGDGEGPPIHSIQKMYSVHARTLYEYACISIDRQVPHESSGPSL